MICPRCGRTIPDGTVCPCSFEGPQLSSNPAVNVIKRLGSSGLFLTLTILFSASALLTILSSATTSDVLNNIYVYGYLYGMDMDLLGQLSDMMRSTSVLSAITGSVPAILVAVAMWIHFATCRGTQSGNISTAGLTICKVLRYIRMIGMCLVTVMVVIIMAIAMILVFSGDLGDLNGVGSFGALFDSYGAASVEEVKLAVAMVLGIFTLIFTFCMVIAITYQASVIRMINRTKISAQTGGADNRVSGYLIGMNWVLGVVTGVYGIITLFGAPVSGLAALASAGGLILAAVLLSRYRKEMDAVLYPPVAPVQPPMYGQPGVGYPQPPMQPQPPYGDPNATAQPPRDVPPQDPPQA